MMDTPNVWLVPDTGPNDLDSGVYVRVALGPDRQPRQPWRQVDVTYGGTTPREALPDREAIPLARMEELTALRHHLGCLADDLGDGADVEVWDVAAELRRLAAGGPVDPPGSYSPPSELAELGEETS